MLKTIIVDDAMLLRSYLKQLIKDLKLPIDVVAEADNVPTAADLIRQLRPDLIFLDVEMPVYSGLELFAFLSETERQFQTIFVTAHSHYAIQAFEHSAAAYLLKPVQAEALRKAVEKLPQQSPVSKKIILSNSEAVHFIDPNQIIYLKAGRSYTEFFLQSQKKILVSRPLSDFEPQLPAKLFFRNHRSYLINLAAVSSYHKQDGGYLLMDNGDKLPISQDKKEDFMEKMLLR